MMKRLLIIKTLIAGIIIMLIYTIIFKTNLIFSEAEISAFLTYMKERNNFLGASNFFIWIVIISALVITALNKMSKVNKKN
jgi:hypothetical protein